MNRAVLMESLYRTHCCAPDHQAFGLGSQHLQVVHRLLQSLLPFLQVLFFEELTPLYAIIRRCFSAQQNRQHL